MFRCCSPAARATAAGWPQRSPWAPTAWRWALGSSPRWTTSTGIRPTSRPCSTLRKGDDVAFPGVYGPCRGLRNAASEAALVEGAGELGEGGVVDAVEHTRWKIESMRKAQTDGDTENSLVMTGQVASAITDLIRIADFVPAMAQQAADVLRRLQSSLT